LIAFADGFINIIDSVSYDSTYVLQLTVDITRSHLVALTFPDLNSVFLQNSLNSGSYEMYIINLYTLKYTVLNLPKEASIDIDRATQAAIMRHDNILAIATYRKVSLYEITNQICHKDCLACSRGSLPGFCLTCPEGSSLSSLGYCIPATIIVDAYYYPELGVRMGILPGYFVNADRVVLKCGLLCKVCTSVS
jgi:hypothetical protein